MENIDIDLSNSTIIDVIDLTKESPRIRSSRLQSRLELHQRKKSKNRTRTQQNNTNVDEIMTLDDSVKNDSNHYIIESEQTTSVLTCPICLEALSSNLRPTTTRCGHIFCAECLETFLRTSKKCPTCKSCVTSKSCIRLYL